MTWIIFGLGFVAFGCAVFSGYQFGRATRSEAENDIYMQGFADGELHCLLNERAPSPN